MGTYRLSIVTDHRNWQGELGDPQWVGTGYLPYSDESVEGIGAKTRSSTLLDRKPDAMLG